MTMSLSMPNACGSGFTSALTDERRCRLLREHAFTTEELRDNFLFLPRRFEDVPPLLEA